MRNDCRVTTLRSELKVVFYALHYGMKPEVEMHDFGFHESETYEVMNHASAGKVAASTCHSLFHYVGARFTNPAWTLHRRPHFDTFQRNRSLLIAPLRWCLGSGVPSVVRSFFQGRGIAPLHILTPFLFPPRLQNAMQTCVGLLYLGH